MTNEKKGLVLINTGKGKGKTTAALGVLFRAWGQGFRICVIQFIKAETGRWGEVKAARKLGIEWHKTGVGFARTPQEKAEAAAKSQEAWALAQAKIVSGEYDLVILDEFTYPLSYGWLDTAETVAWFQENKPPDLHLLITGRDAPSPLIDYADTVTEMRNVKHVFEQGRKAQRGIDF
ncbi:MAG: Cob(I)yrinic acid a,c-diamide adenosyltransferase [Chloroflexi bacterium]|nr:Cob(I)yrinic acid a,c-diamide adenosyltransferase [Chloroflexota bacterium]